MREDILNRVKEIQKDFEYKEIHPNHWICKKPNTSIYCFEIIIGRFQIYIGGDIDSLIFRVGEDYGMNFLAGDDLHYYMYSKLEHWFRTEEVNEAALSEYLYEINDKDLSDEIEYVANDLTLIYKAIYDSKHYNGEMPNISQPKDSIIFVMYMVNYAAKQILKNHPLSVILDAYK